MLDKSDIIILDDAVPLALQDLYLREVSHRYRLWQDYPAEYSAGEGEYIGKYCKSEQFREIPSSALIALGYRNTSGEEDIVSQEYYNVGIHLLEMFKYQTGMNVNRILRMKINKQIRHIDPTYDENCCNNIHTDFDIPHKTLLYYLNDSDGDTMIFNERFKRPPIPSNDPEERAIQLENYIKDREVNCTLAERVTPKKGRFVCFDGLRYHAPSNPIKHDSRYIFNINFISE